jgi:hypothetical protein
MDGGVLSAVACYVTSECECWRVPGNQAAAHCDQLDLCA